MNNIRHIEEYVCECLDCKHRFYYTQYDIKDSEMQYKSAVTNAKLAFGHSLLNITDSRSNHGIKSNQYSQLSKDASSKIIDFNKCTKCGSSKITKQFREYDVDELGNYINGSDEHWKHIREQEKYKIEQRQKELAQKKHEKNNKNKKKSNAKKYKRQVVAKNITPSWTILVILAILVIVYLPLMYVNKATDFDIVGDSETLSVYMGGMYKDIQEGDKIKTAGTVSNIYDGHISMGSFEYGINVTTDEITSINTGDIITVEGKVSTIENNYMTIKGKINTNVQDINGLKIKDRYVLIDYASYDISENERKVIDKANEIYQIENRIIANADNKKVLPILQSEYTELHIDDLLDSYKNNKKIYNEYNKHIRLTAYVKDKGVNSIKVDDIKQSSFFGSTVEFQDISGIDKWIGMLEVGDIITLDGIGNTSGITFSMSNCIIVSSRHIDYIEEKPEDIEETLEGTVVNEKDKDMGNKYNYEKLVENGYKHILLSEIANNENEYVEISGVLTKHPNDKSGIYRLVIPGTNYEDLYIGENDIESVNESLLESLRRGIMRPTGKLEQKGNGNGYICTIRGVIVNKKYDDSWFETNKYYIERAEINHTDVVYDELVSAKDLMELYKDTNSKDNGELNLASSEISGKYHNKIVRLTGRVTEKNGDYCYIDSNKDEGYYSVYTVNGDYNVGDTIDVIGVMYTYRYATQLYVGEMDINYYSGLN